MRTTLNIDEEVLVYVKHLAERSNRSVGDTLSDLAREAIHARTPAPDEDDEMVIPRRPNEPPVTLEFVNSLRDDYL
ncbi:MAG: CopG family transcriptional regulator [Thermomicrobiales bacterium]